MNKHNLLQLKNKLLDYANSLNLHAVGIAPFPIPAEHYAEEVPESQCPFEVGDYADKLNGGSRNIHLKTAVVVLFPYYRKFNGRVNLARYTWGEDYHLFAVDYLQKLQSFLEVNVPTTSKLEYEIHVDTSPLADRHIAYLAGLGFWGKNKCLINDIYGSYFFIGSLLTSLNFPIDMPLNRTCYACNKCINNCLGNALNEKFLDYKKCKSYLTQKKGELTSEEIKIIAKDDIIFGCDICQDVCPHNRDITETPLPEFADITPFLEIENLMNLSNKQFKEIYGHKSFAWRGKTTLIRNHQYINNANNRDKD